MSLIEQFHKFRISNTKVRSLHTDLFLYFYYRGTIDNFNIYTVAGELTMAPSTIKKGLEELDELGLLHALRGALSEKKSEEKIVEKISEEKKEAEPEKKTVKRFVPPTEEEVFTELIEKHKLVSSEARILASRFFNFYESKGWKVGKTTMVSWQRALSGTWGEHIRNANKVATVKKPLR